MHPVRGLGLIDIFLSVLIFVLINKLISTFRVFRVFWFIGIRFTLAFDLVIALFIADHFLILRGFVFLAFLLIAFFVTGLLVTVVIVLFGAVALTV